MRLKHGGFTPKIGGRPAGSVTAVPMPERLILELTRGGITYNPVVAADAQVGSGDPLATAEWAGGTLTLPSPASGRVTVENDRILIHDPQDDRQASGFQPQQLERTSAGSISEILARGGVWPFIWSSRTGGMPDLSGDHRPEAVVVNFILTEPFRARGKVIISRSWGRIAAGIRFLQRMVTDYGTIEIVLTDAKNPVARMMYDDLKGQAWVRFHSVPLTYPIENPRVLADTLRSEVRGLDRSKEIWVIDAQGAEAVGACLDEGLPLHERVVVVGGPSAPNPQHFAVRIGTPLESFVGTLPSESVLLRGGLLTGVPVPVASTGVGYEDDAYFALTEIGKSEFLGFARPGFAKTSYSRSFAGNLFGIRDRTVSATLRGEVRPCIACGVCETVCPAGIMPQIIHRYLYRGKNEEAEKAGLDRCVDCNLCTYVCPSKIELQRQFSEAREQLRLEREEMRAVAARSGGDGGQQETGEETTE